MGDSASQPNAQSLQNLTSIKPSFYYTPFDIPSHNRSLRVVVVFLGVYCVIKWWVMSFYGLFENLSEDVRRNSQQNHKSLIIK